MLFFQILTMGSLETPAPPHAHLGTVRGADPDTHLFIPSQDRAGTRDRSQPVIKSLLNLKSPRMFPPRLSRRGPRHNLLSRIFPGIYAVPLISRDVDFESKRWKSIHFWPIPRETFWGA